MTSSLRRTFVAVLVASFLAVGLSACDPKSDPTIPRGAGFQKTDAGDLRIWFGMPCRDVVEIRLKLSTDKDDQSPVTYDLRSPGYVPSVERPAVSPQQGSGVPAIDGFTLGVPIDGLLVRTALPTDLDWRDYYSAELLVKTTGGQASTYLITARLIKESADHPGKFYVQDQGWFDASSFSTAAKGDFRALCSSINPSDAG